MDVLRLVLTVQKPDIRYVKLAARKVEVSGKSSR